MFRSLIIFGPGAAWLVLRVFALLIFAHVGGRCLGAGWLWLGGWLWLAGLLRVAGRLDSGHFLLGWKVVVGSVAGLDCGTRSGWDVKVFGFLNAFSMGGWGLGDVGWGMGE